MRLCVDAILGKRDRWIHPDTIRCVLVLSLVHAIREPGTCRLVAIHLGSIHNASYPARRKHETHHSTTVLYVYAPDERELGSVNDLERKFDPCARVTLMVSMPLLEIYQ
jgi:hypothetical protein